MYNSSIFGLLQQVEGGGCCVVLALCTDSCVILQSLSSVLQDYIVKLDNFDGPAVAEKAIEYALFEEAFEIYKKFNKKVEAIKVRAEISCHSSAVNLCSLSYLCITWLCPCTAPCTHSLELLSQCPDERATTLTSHHAVMSTRPLYAPVTEPCWSTWATFSAPFNSLARSMRLLSMCIHSG